MLPRCAAAMVLVVTVACASSPPSTRVTREHAIAIAKSHVTWVPFEVSAVPTASQGRRIWRVTMKGRLPGQPPLLFETVIVDLDARSGGIVSVSKT